MRFLPGSRDPETMRARVLADYAARPDYYRETFGIESAERASELVDVAAGGECYVSEDGAYQVSVYRGDVSARGWPPMVHLSVKRSDREPIRDWRVMQEIKNGILGPEHEAVELYPAESRLVDTANQYHLFALADSGLRFPFGFVGRSVSEDEALGSRQRPFAKA